MRKELQEYTNSIEDLIKKKKVTKDIVALHLDKIEFFQHERLIHLIVTCLFATLTIIVLVASLFISNILLMILYLVLLCLLVPYIFHYYFLENSVQHLYKLYDKLIDIDAKLLKK